MKQPKSNILVKYRNYNQYTIGNRRKDNNLDLNKQYKYEIIKLFN